MADVFSFLLRKRTVAEPNKNIFSCVNYSSVVIEMPCAYSSASFSIGRPFFFCFFFVSKSPFYIISIYFEWFKLLSKLFHGFSGFFFFLLNFRLVPPTAHIFQNAHCICLELTLNDLNSIDDLIIVFHIMLLLKNMAN